MNAPHLNRKWTIGGSLGLAAAFVAGLLFSGNIPNVTAFGAHTPAAIVSDATAPVAAPGATTSYADAVDRAAPSVVTIQIEKHVNAASGTGVPGDDFFQQFFGNGQRGRRSMPAPVEHGLGSGVIVSADGDILTNNHVVTGAESVQVTLADGRDFTAKVVGTDAKTDLAVVHIDTRNLPALPLGDSDRVRVGDVVLAVGNPLGVGQTVTMGIISAKSRTGLSEDGAYEDFLQTDAPINQGNSGGALVTTTGELIGINSQIVSGSGGNIGIGFAIPAAMAKNVMTQLISSGHVRRAMLGVTVQTISSDLARSLDLPSLKGGLVSSVVENSPAARAGIKQGDVILKINGTAVQDSNDLRNRISAMAPGSTVTLDVQRDKATRTVTAKLDELAEATHATPQRPADAQSDGGLTVQPVTPALAQRFGLERDATGLVVTRVDSSSAAGRANLQPGDIIRQVNGQEMRSAADLTKALAARSDRPALAYVQRGDGMFYVAIAGER